MDNCLFTRLKGAASNPDLPVFKNIVRKTWMKTTTAGQYINLISIAGQIRCNQLAVDIIFKLESDAGNNTYIFDSNSSYFRVVYLTASGLNVRFVSSTITASCSLGVSHTANASLVTKTFTLNGAEQAVTTESVTTSKPSVFNLFGDRNGANVNPGKLSIGSVIFKSNNTVKAELVPALVDNVPCLYDVLSGNTYTAADGNALAVE